MAKVFREDTKLAAPRYNEDPAEPRTWTGWLDIPKGSNPEAFGLDPADPKVAPYLVEDECAALDEPVVRKGEEPIDLMSRDEMVAECVERGYNPPDRWNKKKLEAKLTELRAAQGGETDVS